MLRKLALLFLIFIQFGAADAQLVKHVILVTIDGFRPDFYLDPSWHADNIRELMKGGAHALGMNSVFPSMTYPSHTTIVTGVQPVKHGIYYNGMYEATGSTGKQYWNANQIKVPTIWEAVRKKGLKASAIFWPVAADAPVNYNIPDIGSMGDSVRGKYSRPGNFFATVKNELFEGKNFDLGRDVNTAKIAAYVIEKDKPNLMTIHFFSVDHFEHEQGRDGPKVREAVAGADSGIAIIVKKLKEAGIWDETIMIVTGDHGFVDVKTSVSPNIWLIKAGLLTDVRKDDWKAQFFCVGGSAYLYLKDRKDAATLNKVKEMLASLPADEKKLFRIIDRKKLDGIGGNPEVEFALTGENNASFGNAMTGEAIKTGKGGSHGYFPDFHEIQTGFVAFGPGIKKGGVIKVMNQRDIAPSVMKMLGIAFPSALGKIPTELFTKN